MTPAVTRKLLDFLPATAEADGYTAEKAKGNIRLVPPGGVFSCRLQFGALDAGEAEQLRKKIEEMMGDHSPS